MVKKPNVRQESFKLLNDQIEFWDRSIHASKEMLKDSKQNKARCMRILLKLQKRYAEQ